MRGTRAGGRAFGNGRQSRTGLIVAGLAVAVPAIPAARASIKAL
jgi:hypothetical protein